MSDPVEVEAGAGNSATESPETTPGAAWESPAAEPESASAAPAIAAPAEIPPPDPWHALYTRHQHEKVTARALEHKGFDVFLPVYNASHRWKDRTKKLSLPLFPGYVFLRGGLDRKLDILSTPGVHCLVRSGDGVAVIPEAEMEAVRQVVRGGFPAAPHPFLEQGDRVRIRSGSLAGLEGMLVRQKDRFRLVLSVELLRRSIAVEVEATAVGFVAHRAPSVPRATSSSRWRPAETYAGGRAARRT